MDDNQRDNFLKDEYLYIQKMYEDFDRRALLIKGWSVTVVLGGLAFGFQTEKPSLWLLAGGVGILFWYIETMWKVFQVRFVSRIKEIEGHFRGQHQANSLVPFQAYDSWSKASGTIPVGRVLEYLKAALMNSVMFPHAIAILTSLILWLFHLPWPRRRRDPEVLKLHSPGH